VNEKAMYNAFWCTCLAFLVFCVHVLYIWNSWSVSVRKSVESFPFVYIVHTFKELLLPFYVVRPPKKRYTCTKWHICIVTFNIPKYTKSELRTPATLLANRLEFNSFYLHSWMYVHKFLVIKRADPLKRLGAWIRRTHEAGYHIFLAPFTVFSS